ncbi:MAG TPA: polysaccharide biosynthesis protein, partial [Burkholderiaceae bacterium]
MKTLFLDLPRKQKQFVAASTDAICLPLMFYSALVLHFETIRFSLFAETAWLAAAASLISIPIFLRFGLYRAVIRFIDHKIIAIVVAGATVSVAILAVLAQLVPHSALSPALFWIFWINTILYVLTSRFIARGFFMEATEVRVLDLVAIYGAGKTGMRLANELKLGRDYVPVAFIDDNRQLQNTTIGGIKVYAPEQVAQLVAGSQIDCFMLAMPSIAHVEQRRVIERLAPHKLKIMSPVTRLAEGGVRLDDIRQIEIEDLLSRDPVVSDPALLTICIENKSVLVSGAGGSIGSELCRQIIGLRPKRLILLERCEFALYTIEQELLAMAATQTFDVELIPLLGSVLDLEKCTDIMHSFEVDTVYHAAAYKHVPLVEHNPVEGIRNNAFGTLSFAKAAATAQVQYFVLISTDKAVRPTNVMGSSKRLAELILQAFARQGSQTRFCMVRFGNVLGSSGSVVPLF